MRVGNVKEIVFSKDPKQMNWLREDFPYAEVKCPPEFSAEVQNEKNGDVLTTKIVVSYNGAHPYFTNAGSIGVSFPLQDRYTDSVTCRDYRCHAHVFCGENTSYIMALRMGGAAPHMGMAPLLKTDWKCCYCKHLPHGKYGTNRVKGRKDEERYQVQSTRTVSSYL